MHIETVTLVIPGLNDDMEEISALIRWVIEHLGPATPMHFSAFHPDYKMMDRGATPVATLEKIYRKAKELGLKYPVYRQRVQPPVREHVLSRPAGQPSSNDTGFPAGFWDLMTSSVKTVARR